MTDPIRVAAERVVRTMGMTQGAIVETLTEFGGVVAAEAIRAAQKATAEPAPAEPATGMVNLPGTRSEFHATDLLTLATRQLGECICDKGPQWDGPEEDCGWHGRTYLAWVDIASKAIAANNEQRLLGSPLSGPTSEGPPF